MKTILSPLILGSALLLGAPPLYAQTVNTNSLPLVQTIKYQVAVESDRDLGEHALFPPGLREKLRLTDEERVELRPIEADFAKTSQDYQVANQPRIYAATEANRQARESKSAPQIEAARHQLQQTWSGLQKYRDESIRQVKLVLTPDQVAMLEDPANQWREEHHSEVNDPSSN